MKNLSMVSRDEVSEYQVIKSRVAKTQQPDAERLISLKINKQINHQYLAVDHFQSRTDQRLKISASP